MVYPRVNYTQWIQASEYRKAEAALEYGAAAPRSLSAAPNPLQPPPYLPSALRQAPWAPSIMRQAMTGHQLMTSCRGATFPALAAPHAMGAACTFARCYLILYLPVLCMALIRQLLPSCPLCAPVALPLVSPSLNPSSSCHPNTALRRCRGQCNQPPFPTPSLVSVTASLFVPVSVPAPCPCHRDSHGQSQAPVAVLLHHYVKPLPSPLF